MYFQDSVYLIVYQFLKFAFYFLLQMDLTVWPAAQALNFYMVPAHYRVAYVSFVTTLWNIYLSNIKHKVFMS